MNFKILGEIILFAGVAWYINSIYNFVEFNKVTKVKINRFNRFNNPINDTTDYSKIFPTNNIDVDTIILCNVDKKTLHSLLTVNKYLANIIVNNSFWRLRMGTRLGLTTKNVDTNFKSITNLLDNSKSLSDNMYYIMLNRGCKYFQQVYDLLGENKKYGYFYKNIKNENLKRTVDTLYKNIFRSPRKTQYDFKEFKLFVRETILLIDKEYNFKYSYFNQLTDIIRVEIVVNFQDNDENIFIQCNKPSKLITLLFELSRKLDIKTISITNNENVTSMINKLLYKIIERLT